MNSTIPSNSTGAILCPLNGRRSSTELYVKLGIVHFTTLSFFFHLARRRDGSYLCWNWIFYVETPLNIVFRYVFGLLGILSFYIFRVILRKARQDSESEPLETLRTPLRWLLGKAPKHGYALLPTAEDNDNNGNNHAHGEDYLAKKIGKTFVNGAFMVQCVGAIFLYHRRLKRDAVTLVDQRVFELACGGLVIGILTLGLSFNAPIFKDHVPDGAKTRIDRYALFWRDGCSEDLLAFKGEYGEYPLWMKLLKNIGITCIILAIIYPSEAKEAFWLVSAPLWSSSIFGLLIFFLVILPVSFICLRLPFQVYKEDKLSQKSTILTRRPYLRWIISPISATLGALLMYVAVYIMWGYFFSFQYYLWFWFLAFNQVGELSKASIDKACPLLWSDPLAEYVWWLA